VAAAGAQHKLELASKLAANVTVNYADPDLRGSGTRTGRRRGRGLRRRGRSHRALRVWAGTRRWPVLCVRDGQRRGRSDTRRWRDTAQCRGDMGHSDSTGSVPQLDESRAFRGGRSPRSARPRFWRARRRELRA